MSIVFQTRDLATAERLDYWQAMVSRHHVAVSPEGAVAPDFEGRMKIDDWGGLQLSDTAFSPVAYRRGPREMKSCGRDDFLCVLNLGEGGVFEHNGGSFGFAAGDMVVYDTGQPYAIRFPRRSHTVSLRIPRPQVIARLPRADRQFALHLDGRRPLAQLAASLLKSASSLETLPDPQRCREAEAPILDVLCLAVKDVFGEDMRASPGQEQLLGRIKRRLKGQLEDCSLSVESIARAEGISPRTLNRLFAAEGTTAMRWVWQQRLAAAYRAMSEGSVRQVTEAAFMFGFKDSSHFTRAFKKEYGIPPSRLLLR
ncbi:helix-turn-helix domain-containing protein [Poseidonocella sp. HB161398]|uniref:helix-turn-helix domain-containing protein n=1 Tax=Poseidonocella sp. HB161398 TaxID=2320855 RepID=UPI001108FA78|nr:helix-turn-helix domain-containing protein [Poseidonocella sp. HB161398]